MLVKNAGADPAPPGTRHAICMSSAAAQLRRARPPKIRASAQSRAASPLRGHGFFWTRGESLRLAPLKERSQRVSGAEMQLCSLLLQRSSAMKHTESQFIPLNKLKKSPRNVRQVPHSKQHI